MVSDCPTSIAHLSGNNSLIFLWRTNSVTQCDCREAGGSPGSRREYLSPKQRFPILLTSAICPEVNTHPKVTQPEWVPTFQVLPGSLFTVSLEGGSVFIWWMNSVMKNLGFGGRFCFCFFFYHLSAVLHDKAGLLMLKRGLPVTILPSWFSK